MNYLNGFKHNGSSYEIIGLEDQRKRIANTTKEPFRWICSIEVKFPEPVVYSLGLLENKSSSWDELPKTINGCGSGLLIGVGKVLTNAHVLMGLKVHKHPDSGKTILTPVLASEVVVTPSRNMSAIQSAPFGRWKAEGVKVHPSFKRLHQGLSRKITTDVTRKALEFDVGMIQLQKRYHKKLERNILPGERIGWWKPSLGYHIKPVDDHFRKHLEKRKVNVCGFPGDKSRGSCGQMYISFDKVSNTHLHTPNGKLQNLISHYADTKAGMSGSPIWIKNKDGKRYLVGVHSSFLRDEKAIGGKGLVNVGVLLTGEILARFSE